MASGSQEEEGEGEGETAQESTRWLAWVEARIMSDTHQILHDSALGLLCIAAARFDCEMGLIRNTVLYPLRAAMEH
jgi:hypothetical protein